MKTVLTLLIALAVVAVLGTAVLYSGSYNIAADEPHWGFTSGVIETMRDRSIARQARGVAASASLNDENSAASGAGEYAEMCTGCHLAPGMKDTELRKGLYPMPPNLTEHGAHRTPAEQFWIIKHGLKMTGMPAWGLTHDDERIWSMVAFLQKLPGMTPVQYQQLVKSCGGGHSHDGTEGDEMPAGHEDSEGDAAATPPKTAEKPGAHAHGNDAHGHDTQEPASAISARAAEAAAVVDEFQKFLAQGKTREASALLDPNVLIFEGGGAERSRAEYASHHLKSDAEFLKSATVAVLSRTGDVIGDLAWIATESQLKTDGAKPLDLMTTETMVLKRMPEGWRVTHIHWSSKAKK